MQEQAPGGAILGLTTTNIKRSGYNVTGSTRKDKCLSEEEMDTILNYDDRSMPIKTRNSVALHLLAGTGLKVYEALELMISDVDTTTGYLTAGRGAKRRELPMDPRTNRLMREYISEFRNRFINQQDSYKCMCDNVLISVYLKPFTRNNCLKLIRAIGKELGLDLNAEIIRHSFTYHLYKGNFSLLLKRTGITAESSLEWRDMPTDKTELVDVMRKYHPRF